jgi:hypothetical protein
MTPGGAAAPARPFFHSRRTINLLHRKQYTEMMRARALLVNHSLSKLQLSFACVGSDSAA